MAQTDRATTTTYPQSSCRCNLHTPILPSSQSPHRIHHHRPRPRGSALGERSRIRHTTPAPADPCISVSRPRNAVGPACARSAASLRQDTLELEFLGQVTSVRGGRCAVGCRGGSDVAPDVRRRRRCGCVRVFWGTVLGVRKTVS